MGQLPVVAPAVTERGQIQTVPILPGIVDVQRRVSKEQGCAFFDTFSAMGGKDSIARWYRNKPRLVTSDFQHATPRGYRIIADLYYKALIKGFAEYLEKK